MGEIELSGQELGGNVGVNFTIVELNWRGCQDLVVHHLRLLAVLVLTREVVSNGSLGHSLVAAVVALTVVTILVHASIVLVLSVGGGRGGLSGRGCLRRSAKTREQMRAASARSRSRVLSNGADGGRRGHAQALQRGALTTGRKASAGHSEAAVGLEVVESHLSKTACVHAHDVFGGKGGWDKGWKGYRIEEDCRGSVRGAVNETAAKVEILGDVIQDACSLTDVEGDESRLED